MLAFRSHDAEGCVTAYLAERPSFFGIVRRISWRETFAAEVQHTREVVAAGLISHLEETREDWEAALDRVAARDAVPVVGARQAPPAAPSPAEGDTASAIPEA